MPIQTLHMLLSCALATACTVAGAQASPSTSCDVDRTRLLALNEEQFDQDMAGGWRAVADKPGCTLAAADLLRDYRQAQPKPSGLLVWHEAQLRAEAGQYPQAIALMKQAYKPAEADRAGWNLYVDATIAFLSRDRAALAHAKARLAAVKVPVAPGIPPVVDGYMEMDFADGSKRKMRWPPNIDIVEGLERCFDKPYNEAYGGACQQGKR